jgi:AcrR family transcriptional regulator
MRLPQSRYSISKGSRKGFEPVTEAIDFMRKKPVQNRTRRTMADIFEATAQLLQSGGAEALNTNRVAERAGYSIGTLYSYFPDKNALLRATAIREIHRQETRACAVIAEARAQPPAAIARAVLRCAMSPFEGRNGVRRALIVLLGHDAGLQTAINATIERISEALIEAMNDGQGASVSRAARFIALRAAMGAIRAAALQEPALLRDPAFEDLLVDMVMGLIAPDASRRD